MTTLITGSGNIVLIFFIQNQVMTQRLRAFHSLGLACYTAHRALLAHLFRLGAGGVNQAFLKDVLTSSGNGLGLLLLADRAGVQHLAVLTTGGLFLDLTLIPHVIGRDCLVAQTCFAKFTNVLADAVGLAGGSLEYLLKLCNVCVLIHRKLSTLVENLAAHRADSLSSQAGGLAGGGDILNSLFLMSQRGLCKITLQLVHIAVIAALADVLYASGVVTVGIHQFAVVKIMTQRLSVLFLGVVAAAALEGVVTTLITGSGNIVLIFFIQNQVMTQRLRAFHSLGLACYTAHRALLAHLFRLGAGGVDHAFLKDVLACSGNGLGLFLAAGRAGVQHLAVLAAGDFFLDLTLIPHMIGRDGLVAQILSAKLAGVLTDARGRAGSGLEYLLKLFHMRILIYGNLSALVENLAAHGADYLAGQAGGLAGGGDILNSLFLMFQSGLRQIALQLVHIAVVATLADVLYASGILTVGIHQFAVVIIMTQRLSVLFLGVVAAAALESVMTTLFAGSGNIVLVVLVQNQIVTQRLGALYSLCFADRTALCANLADLCRLGAGGIDHFLRKGMTINGHIAQIFLASLANKAGNARHITGGFLQDLIHNRDMPQRRTDIIQNSLNNFSAILAALHDALGFRAGCSH